MTKHALIGTALAAATLLTPASVFALSPACNIQEPRCMEGMARFEQEYYSRAQNYSNTPGIYNATGAGAYHLYSVPTWSSYNQSPQQVGQGYGYGQQYGQPSQYGYGQYPQSGYGSQPYRDMRYGQNNYYTAPIHFPVYQTTFPNTVPNQPNYGSQVNQQSPYGYPQQQYPRYQQPYPEHCGYSYSGQQSTCPPPGQW